MGRKNALPLWRRKTSLAGHNTISRMSQRMQPTTIKELQWLHDSDVLNIEYDFTNERAWSIRLTLSCPTDLGYAPWEGRVLVLLAADVVRSNHSVCSVVGSETFDQIDPGVSQTLQANASREGRSGREAFTIAFISGSTLEVICQELLVEIKE